MNRNEMNRDRAEEIAEEMAAIVNAERFALYMSNEGSPTLTVGTLDDLSAMLGEVEEATGLTRAELLDGQTWALFRWTGDEYVSMRDAEAAYAVGWLVGDEPS